MFKKNARYLVCMLFYKKIMNFLCDIKKIPQQKAGVFFKLGTYLLSHLIGSTIGPGGLNFSVRNGKRCYTAGLGTLEPLLI